MLFDIIKIAFKLVKSLVNIITKRGKNNSFADLFDNIQGMPESSKPLVETLAGDLLLTYAVDYGDSYVSITKDNLNNHAHNVDELRPMAEENALDAMREIRKHEGLVNSLTTQDNLVACSILYPALWHQIENEMGGKILVAFVHRDTVLYVREDDENAVSELQRIIDEDIDYSDTHSLSKSLYRLSGNDWQVSSISQQVAQVLPLH